MQTAEQLMKKSVFKAEMDRTMSRDQSDSIWKESTEKLQCVMDHYGKLPSGIQSHTDKIFQTAASYPLLFLATKSDPVLGVFKALS